MLSQTHPLNDVEAHRKREKNNFKRHYLRAVRSDREAHDSVDAIEKAQRSLHQELIAEIEHYADVARSDIDWCSMLQQERESTRLALQELNGEQFTLMRQLGKHAYEVELFTNDLRMLEMKRAEAMKHRDALKYRIHSIREQLMMLRQPDKQAIFAAQCLPQKRKPESNLCGPLRALGAQVSTRRAAQSGPSKLNTVRHANTSRALEMAGNTAYPSSASSTTANPMTKDTHISRADVSDTRNPTNTSLHESSDMETRTTVGGASKAESGRIFRFFGESGDAGAGANASEAGLREASGQRDNDSGCGVCENDDVPQVFDQDSMTIDHPNYDANSDNDDDDSFVLTQASIYEEESDVNDAISDTLSATNETLESQRRFMDDLDFQCSSEEKPQRTPQHLQNSHLSTNGNLSVSATKQPSEEREVMEPRPRFSHESEFILSSDKEPRRPPPAQHLQNSCSSENGDRFVSATSQPKRERECDSASTPIHQSVSVSSQPERVGQRDGVSSSAHDSSKADEYSSLMDELDSLWG